MEDDGSFGTGFWLKVFGTVIGIGIAIFLILIFIHGMFARWGFIGGMIVFGDRPARDRPGSPTSGTRRRTASTGSEPA